MKKLLKRFLRSKGYIPVKPIQHEGQIEFKIGDLHYDFVSPIANFSPWRGDMGFIKTYERIKDFTLVDIYRCFELWQIIDQVAKANRGLAFMEIGVWRGGTAGIIASKLQSLSSNSKLYLADTFSGVVKASDKDDFYTGFEHNDTDEKIVIKLFSGIGYANYKILKGIFPEETATNIPETELFCFCHIDVDVYESGKDMISWIWDKMVVGGILVFDDYGFHWCTGITKLVDEQRGMDDRIVIHNLNGHAIIIKSR